MQADLLAEAERTARVQADKMHDALDQMLSKQDLKTAKVLEEQARAAAPWR